jgi:SsrA-binding protein
MAPMSTAEEKVVASNRKARHLYEILETFEAGIVLVGPEVKSLREARANLGDAYGVIRKGECWLEKLHISPYEPATRDNPDVQRSRKLLYAFILKRVGPRSNSPSCEASAITISVRP